MSAVPAVKYMTVEEYLAMEDASLQKHEYIGGEVHAMAGAGISHNRIVRNAVIEIGQFLKGKPCEIFQADLKINVKTESAFVYPDITIVCDGLQLLKDREDIVTNPSVIIEVLSASTEDYDHGKKIMLYRQLPTLKEYILISSMEMLVEKFIREESGAWTLTDYRNANDKLSINTIAYTTSLAEIYRDVTFDQTPETA